MQVVALRPGRTRPTSRTASRSGSAAAEPYPLYRVRLEIERAPDRQSAHQRVREILNRIPDSPERHDAWRFANDRLGMTVQLQRGVADDGGRRRRSRRGCSRRATASSATRSPGWPRTRICQGLLAELAPEHFDVELHRRARAHLLDADEPADEELVPLLAELDARAAEGGIDDETAKELLLRLRERQLRRELAGADLERTKELQEQLERIRATAANLA